jgi:hypothetical protein
VKRGKRIGDIGAAIQEYAEAKGCSVVRFRRPPLGTPSKKKQADDSVASPHFTSSVVC